MRDEISSKMPEIDLISDEGLRQGVISAIERCLRFCGLGPEALERFPFTLSEGGDRVSLLAHTRAVARVCHAAASAFNECVDAELRLNLDLLLAGALLHDLGKLVEFAPAGEGAFEVSEMGRAMRHPFWSAHFCLEAGLPMEVVHLVGSHSHEGEGRRASAEAIFLHKVDFMVYEATLKKLEG